MSLNTSEYLQTISLQNVKKSLGLDNLSFSKLLRESKIQKVKNKRGKPSLTIENFNNLRNYIQENAPKSILLDLNYQRNVLKVEAMKATLADNVIVNVRDRSSAPEKAIIFVGPTNSGKTYHGLEELFNSYENNPDQIHVYCGPLRLLAFEVYNKMKERFGEDAVGFITGEEAINPEAKLLACTCEMAPAEGKAILVDEAHWLADPDRGHIWSRILLSSKYENFYIITAKEALEVVKKLTEDIWNTEIREFYRKTPISFKGTLDLKAIPPKTAVVCFSRKSVYSVAAALTKVGKKVGVLYGGLPLRARKSQIQAYIDGKYDIMVTTDVIGHGINLPIDNVVFAQTEKFDGRQSRSLYIWEMAQIAGRAGRFGLSKEGGVYLVSGLPWFSKDKDLVKLGALAAGGKITTDLLIEEALISPRLGDLGLDPDGGNIEASKLLASLEFWKDKATLALQDRILTPSDLESRVNNIGIILRTIGSPSYPWDKYERRILSAEDFTSVADIDLNEMWQLASGPFDANLNTIAAISKWLISPFRDTTSSLDRFFREKVETLVERIGKLRPNEAAAHIELLEEAIRVNAELKMAVVMFGSDCEDSRLGTLPASKLFNAENEINTIIIKILSAGIKEEKAKSCVRCGRRNSKPWHKECDSCHETSRTLRYKKHDE